MPETIAEPDQFHVVTFFFFFVMRTQPGMVYLRAGAGMTEDLIGTLNHTGLFFHKFIFSQSSLKKC